MKVYYARASSTTQAEAFEKGYMAKTSIRLKILLSFHYYEGTDLHALIAKKFAPHIPEIFIDSGGFSAMTQGASIDLDKYAAYIKRYRDVITTYANLDVIGDAAATLANQKRLEDHGLQPLPVFHTGEPWEYLERYVEAYPYVALGGMVPHMRRWKRLMPWLVKAFKIAKGRAVFHGFGATAWGVIRSLPWFSVDSSSWSSSFRFGVVPLFDVRRGEFQQVQLGDATGCARNASLIRAHGFEPVDFSDRSRNSRSTISAISALAYIRAEEWLRKRHGEIRIPETADGGVRIYLANTAQAAVYAREASHVLGERADIATDAPNTGTRIYLADAQSGASAKDSAAAATILNGPRIYLADTTGHDAPTVSAVLNQTPGEATP